MATKEQERKALAQIKKIVEGLGEDSYIGIAFEGCFEIAEENIQNDWGCSMKDRWETAEAACDLRRAEAKGLQTENEQLKEKLKAQIERTEEYYKLAQENKEDLDMIAAKKNEYKEAMQREYAAKVEAENKVAELENEIIQLKAKLYDLMVK